MLASKFNFVNLLNSELVIKPVATSILFSISVAFALKRTLARLVILDILLSNSAAFYSEEPLQPD